MSEESIKIWIWWMCKCDETSIRNVWHSFRLVRPVELQWVGFSNGELAQMDGGPTARCHHLNSSQFRVNFNQMRCRCCFPFAKPDNWIICFDLTGVCTNGTEKNEEKRMFSLGQLPTAMMVLDGFSRMGKIRKKNRVCAFADWRWGQRSDYSYRQGRERVRGEKHTTTIIALTHDPDPGNGKIETVCAGKKSNEAENQVDTKRVCEKPDVEC